MPDSLPYDSHSENHRMAVIVPFRNRFEELQEFVPYMKTFLRNQSVPNDIYIVNQVKSQPFSCKNGSLISTVFRLTTSGSIGHR